MALMVTVDNKIRFQLSPDAKTRWPEFVQQLSKDMVFRNPAHQDAVKYNRSTRGIPAKIALWEFDRNTRVLSLPRGYTGQFLKLLKQHGIQYQVDDLRMILEPVSFDSKFVLRSYQKPAVEALLKGTQGVLQAPAGSGKTVLGMEVIARIGQPALWLTHTKDLADQAVERATQFLKIPQEEIGVLGNGQETVGPRLTVGIIQKMVRMDLAEVAPKFGTVVLDESAHCPAATWSTIVNTLPAKYRYGLSATPDRADGLEIVTERVIGPKLYIITREEVEAAGGVIVPKLRVLKTGCESETWTLYKNKKEAGKAGSTIPFGKILNEVLTNNNRNRLIVEMLLDECPGHCSLVLSERVAHCEELAGWLKSHVQGASRRNSLYNTLRVEVIHGKINKTKRQEILAAINAGELDVLFAVDIAKEGLDIPRLDRLFLVAGGRNAAEIEQKIGRIQRSFPGKKEAVVFDFVDEKIGVLYAQYWARRKVYKKLGIGVGV